MTVAAAQTSAFHAVSLTAAVEPPCFSEPGMGFANWLQLVTAFINIVLLEQSGFVYCGDCSCGKAGKINLSVFVNAGALRLFLLWNSRTAPATHPFQNSHLRVYARRWFPTAREGGGSVLLRNEMGGTMTAPHLPSSGDGAHGPSGTQAVPPLGCRQPSAAFK